MNCHDCGYKLDWGTRREPNGREHTQERCKANMRAKVKLLRGLLKLAHGYISGVNADWPRGQDDDRDAILDKIEQAITDAPLPAAKEMS